MTKFKVGDIVKPDAKRAAGSEDWTGRVTNINVPCCSDGKLGFQAKTITGTNCSADTWLNQEWSKKEKPDDLVRYMVYGMGCNNKGNPLHTEKELKTELKNRSKDSDWSGRIIGYKLVPLYEVHKRTVLTRLTKIKPIKKKKTKK